MQKRMGYIAPCLLWNTALFAMRLGAGRAVKSGDLDYETGIVFAKKVGDPVQKMETLLQLFIQI